MFAITWYNIGEVDKGDWLSFGVATTGQVRLVRASFPGMISFKWGSDPTDAALIPAELVPGGRSLPDPAKAFKSGKIKDINGPPLEIEILSKLGNVRDIKLTIAEGSAQTPRVEKPNETAQATVGKPLAPDMLAALGNFRRSQVKEVLVTASRSISVDELTDIMGGTRIKIDDTKTFPGLTICWFRYSWIDYGIVDGQVKKLRIRCAAMPMKL